MPFIGHGIFSFSSKNKKILDFIVKKYKIDCAGEKIIKCERKKYGLFLKKVLTRIMLYDSIISVVGA